MRRQRIILGGLLLVLLGAAALVPYEHPAVRYGNGENVYRGRPSSYWAQRIFDWDDYFPLSERFSLPWLRKVETLLGLDAPPAVLNADRAAMPVLMDLLNHPNSFIHDMAENALRDGGSVKGEVILGVMDVLKQGTPRMRYEVVMLVHILGPEMAPVLLVALEDEDPDISSEAANLLGELGTDALPYLPNRGSPRQRRVVHLLRELAATGDQAPVVKEALQDEDERLRVVAECAVARLKREREWPR